MTRLGWQALLLLPLLLVICGLARYLRTPSGRVVRAPRVRFMVLSILFHAGLLFALDLVLVTIPVVGAHKERIEAAFVQTFSIFSAGRGGSGPSWERLAEGPAPVDPAVEPAGARLVAGKEVAFDPSLAGIAPTIPEALVSTLPPDRVLFLPRPAPTPTEAPTLEFPRAVAVEPELPGLEPPPLDRVAPAAESAPEAPIAEVGRRGAELRPPAPSPTLPATVEPRFPEPGATLAPAGPISPVLVEPPAPLPIGDRRYPPLPDPTQEDQVPPPRAVPEPGAPVAEAPPTLPRTAARDVDLTLRPPPAPRSLPRLDPPLPAITTPRSDFLPRLDALPPPPLERRMPASDLAVALAVEPPDLQASFSLRPPEVRKDLVGAMGGTEASEAAVDRGLAWLAAHQGPAGNWSLEDLHCQGHRCDAPGSARSDAAATGLALMALLGAGHSPARGTHAASVQRGVDWLIARQNSEGGLAEPGGSQMYGHALATIALCEALGLGADPALREPAARAVRFIVEAQDPNTGGWRYQPRGGGDTSVFGWQLMALKSAEMAGLPVPAETYRLSTRWLDSVASGPQRHLSAYQPGGEVRPSMTAEALLCRQYLGVGRSDPSMSAGGLYLRSKLPEWGDRHLYYWYYATQVMYHLQGQDWAAWNGKLRDMLVESQARDGPAAGSWDPQRPTPDKRGDRGGRLYETTLSLLILEVYYRHLPLYQQLSGGGAAEGPISR